MSYLVLARKYRPQSFEDVVGQTPVSRTLSNALETGRVAHGYIFSGPRGVGKTTTARILAKCLNCEKGPTTTPCNKCDACVSISQGTSTDDVLEIDGASNRGIEQIRELRESAKYTPAHSRYRIYIIDEAHQITKDAFGALLKTLEEPPPHVVFMMATTEVQKIPAPILSRCQRFSLRPISAELVFKHLKEICAKEKVKVEDAALADIVRFVEGSLRDALSLLDQALVFSPKGITASTVRELLGLLPLELITTFAATIRAGDPAAVLKSVDEAVRGGVDLTQLAKDLQSHYHNLLLAKAGVEDAFKVDDAGARKQAADFDFPTLERNIRLLSRLLDEMRNSETPRALFEVFSLRLGQKTLDPRALLERLEKLEKAGPAVIASATPAGQTTWRPAAPPRAYSAPPASVGPGTREPETSFSAARANEPPRSAERPAPSASPAPTASPVSAKSPDPAPTSASMPLDEVPRVWSVFAQDVGKSKASLGAALEDARPSIENGRLVLIFSASFNADLVQRSMEVLRPAMTRHFGAPIVFDSRVEKPASSAGKPAARAAAPAGPPVGTPETFVESKPEESGDDVKRALKHFPGTVKKERR